MSRVVQIDTARLSDAFQNMLSEEIRRDAEAISATPGDGESLLDTAQLIRALAACFAASIMAITKDDQIERRLQVADYFREAMQQASIGMKELALRQHLGKASE